MNMPETSIDPALLPQTSQTEPPRQKREYVRKKQLPAAQQKKRKRKDFGVAGVDGVTQKPIRKKRQKTQARSLIVKLKYRKGGSLETHWIKTPGFVDLQLGTPPTELTVPRSLLASVPFFQEALRSAAQPTSDAPHTTIALPDITPAAAWLYIQYRYADSIVPERGWRRVLGPQASHPHSNALGKADWIETLLSAHALGVKVADTDFKDIVFDELVNAIQQNGSLEPHWGEAFYAHTPAGCAARLWFVDSLVVEQGSREVARGLKESDFGKGFWFEMTKALLHREAAEARWMGGSICAYHEHGEGRACYTVRQGLRDMVTVGEEEVSAETERVDEVVETRRRDTILETAEEEVCAGRDQRLGDAYDHGLDHDDLSY